MKICNGCGGILGRDCFNEAECTSISNNYDQYDIQELRNEIAVLRKAIIDFGIPIPDVENSWHSNNSTDDLPF